MKLKGMLHIGRPMGGSQQPPMTIEVTDEPSGLNWIEIEVNHGDLMLSLTGMSVPVTLVMREQAVPLLGMNRQVKHVMLEGVDYRNHTATYLEAVGPYEVDGWKHSTYEANSHNSHHSVFAEGKRLYKATLTRFVPVEQEDTE